MERPSKRARLLLDDDASGSDSGDDAGATLKVNDEYAKRFQHNKAREDRQRLEEKYGDAEPSDSNSESEDEDEEAMLATQELDAEIFATLEAIKKKDPKVYDSNVTFYTLEDPSVPTKGTTAEKKEKPVFLRDYHRKNLMDSGPDAEGDVPMTYNEEQMGIKRGLLMQMNEVNSDEDDFMVKKPGQKLEVAPAKPRIELDPSTADKDPETYLSNFMAARAWRPTSGSQFPAFESEDEDEVDNADDFERAFNLRFENPAGANEKLISHSRLAAEKYSARREEPKTRKKMRDAEKAKRDAEKLEREEDKARLRRLKIEEAQEKLQRFKEAAGLDKQAVPVEEWAKFLGAGWDSEKWDHEMAKRFGENYYAVQDDEEGEGVLEGETDRKRKKKSKVKRPKWNDDIAIGDLVPDFDEEEERRKFQLYDNEDNEDNNAAGSDYDDDDDDNGGVAHADAPDPLHEDNPHPNEKPKHTKKDFEKARMEKKRQLRLERQKIEDIVDRSLGTDLPTTTTSRFRYRETSPSTFGLNSLDILMADDSQLNAYAGLKKLASFREPEKKKKDKKKLGKKSRLRQWRKETFGDEEGSKIDFEEFLNRRRDVGMMGNAGVVASGDNNVLEGQRKRKRSKKSKAAGGEGSS